MFLIEANRQHMVLLISSRAYGCLSLSTLNRSLPYAFSSSNTARKILLFHSISLKLIKLAKRWQKFAAIRRKRISFPILNDDSDSCSTSSAVNKGHFAIYTADQKRFVVPLSYLENEIIRQLLNMSEEEFGLPAVGLLHYHVMQPSWTTSFHFLAEVYPKNLRMHCSSQLLPIGVHQLHCTKKAGEIKNC